MGSMLARLFVAVITALGRSRWEPAPTRDAFQAGFDFIMSPDIDGRQNDSAPGETFRTSWGITQMTWDNAVAHGLVTGHLEDCTMAQAKVIYRAMYYNPLRCSDLPAPAAFAMFCDSVLTGVGHVAKLAQRIVGEVEDGVVGPKTVAAISKMPVAHFVDDFIIADVTYLKSLASAPKFINGWTRRETATHVRAMELA